MSDLQQGLLPIMTLDFQWLLSFQNDCQMLDHAYETFDMQTATNLQILLNEARKILR